MISSLSYNSLSVHSKGLKTQKQITKRASFQKRRSPAPLTPSVVVVAAVLDSWELRSSAFRASAHEGCVQSISKYVIGNWYALGLFGSYDGCARRKLTMSERGGVGLSVRNLNVECSIYSQNSAQIQNRRHKRAYFF